MLEESIENLIFKFIKTHELYSTLIIASIIIKLKEKSKVNIFTVWAIYIVGTFFHELTHLIASIVTNGKPIWFNIFPSKTLLNGKIHYTLGYVENNNIRWYNSFIINMAPLVLLFLSFLVHQNFFLFVAQNLYTYVLYIFITISLLFSSIPSGTDFRNVFQGTKIFGNMVVPISLLLILFYKSNYTEVIKGYL